MPKTKLIIFSGYPASGKTTLARLLAQKLNIFCLHKDSLKENLYDFLNLKTLEDSQMIGLVSIKLMFALAEETLESGIDLIMEAPFSHLEDVQMIKRW